jgi:arylsulfatase A-like enzyme
MIFGTLGCPLKKGTGSAPILHKATILIVIFLAAQISFSAEKQAPDAGSQRRPNVLFIMTDEQRWDCVGANGNRLIRTPSLDRLAEQSANFRYAFVQAPVCVPSRASYFTGRYAHSHRNRVNYTPLDRSEVLMQARLKAEGYATASVGKLHYYPPTKEEAQRTGFDFVELHDGVRFTDEWSDYAKWRQQNDPQAAAYYYRSLAKDVKPGENPFRAAIQEQFSETTWTGQRTRHFLKRLSGQEKPFFLFCSFWKPHPSFEVPAPFSEMYNGVEIPLPAPTTLAEIQRLPPPLQALILRQPGYNTDRWRLEWMYRSYYGAISHIDREVGAILQTVAETGQADRTIVVFASDHGDQMMEHGLMGKNCFFEASIRVPLMIRLPGRVRPATYDELVETIDLLPTLLELCGVPEPVSCQGRSLVPLIAPDGRPYEPRDAVFSENIIPEVITDGRLDFSFEKGKGIKGIRHPDAKMVRTRRWKYIYYPEGYAELYDLENDPHELTNLAGGPDCRAVEQELKDRILKWLVTASETDQIAPRWLLPKQND